jgi:hypothetical protein
MAGEPAGACRLKAVPLSEFAMGMIIAVFAVTLMDPIRLIVVLAIVAAWRSPWAILVSTLVSAGTMETLLTATQFIRIWGQGLGFGLATSLVQALVIYGLFEVWRSRRAKPKNRPTGQPRP